MDAEHFDESKVNRNEIGRFAQKSSKEISVDIKKEINTDRYVEIETAQAKTPNRVNIDFDNDNVLPELKPKDLEKMQTRKNKRVLLKKSIIKNNNEKHGDIEQDEIPWLIGETLYNSDDIVKGKNPSGNYYSFVKLMEKFDKRGNKMFGVVLLDINETNEYFEIVHWHWVRQKSRKSI